MLSRPWRQPALRPDVSSTLTAHLRIIERGEYDGKNRMLCDRCQELPRLLHEDSVACASHQRVGMSQTLKYALSHFDIFHWGYSHP